MDHVPNTENYYKPHHVIEDFNVLQQIVKRLGFRWTVASKITKEEIVNKDVVRQ